MDNKEVLRRCEENLTLFRTTIAELEAARAVATREIHRHILGIELKNRRLASHRAKKNKPDNKPRSLRKEDRWIGILLGTHGKFGRPIPREEA